MSVVGQIVQSVDGELEQLGRCIKLGTKLTQSVNHALRYHVGMIVKKCDG